MTLAVRQAYAFPLPDFATLPIPVQFVRRLETIFWNPLLEGCQQIIFPYLCHIDKIGWSSPGPFHLAGTISTQNQFTQIHYCAIRFRMPRVSDGIYITK